MGQKNVGGSNGTHSSAMHARLSDRGEEQRKRKRKKGKREMRDEGKEAEKIKENAKREAQAKGNLTLLRTRSIKQEERNVEASVRGRAWQN